MLLGAVRDGEQDASNRLLQTIYEELRRLARARMRSEPADHTLQATALVHEAYLRLMQDSNAEWENRRHFFASAAQAMRRILVERHRRVSAEKRGGDKQRVELEPELQLANADGAGDLDLLALR